MVDTRSFPLPEPKPTAFSGDHVLIVRIWREPNRATPEDNDWRGYIYLSRISGKRYFVGMDRLFRAIRTLLRQAARSDYTAGLRDSDKGSRRS